MQKEIERHYTFYLNYTLTTYLDQDIFSYYDHSTVLLLWWTIYRK